MSTKFEDISYDLVDGIFDCLDAKVIYGGITYPVYKSVPKVALATYVYICNVVQTEDGSKDYFLYYGTVQIHIVDESMERGDMKLSQAILNVVRGLLKTTKGSVFALPSHTLCVFKHESFNTIIGEGDTGLTKIRLIDMYNFLIQ